MNWLFGTSGTSLFDVWFIVHFCFWLVYGAQVQVFGWSRMIAMLVCVGVAFAWEAFERGAFVWWPEVWKHSESWQNAIVGDIALAGLLGTLAGYWLAENQ